MSDTEIRATVKDLASAISTQAQVANRTWLAAMTVAIFGAVPREVQKMGIELPFSLGHVDPAWFYAIIFLMLIVLVVAFSAAHAQQVRTQDLVDIQIDKLVKSGATHGGIHPRELLDMFRLPSVIRVAPLAQAFRDKYQFASKEHQCPPNLRRVSNGYYALLKLAAILIYFGLPGLALFRVYSHLPVMGVLLWIMTGGGILASLTLIQVSAAEIQHMAKTLEKLGGLRR